MVFKYKVGDILRWHETNINRQNGKGFIKIINIVNNSYLYEYLLENLDTSRNYSYIENNTELYSNKSRIIKVLYGT